MGVIGSSRSFAERIRPLASREALTYRAARRIATRATPRQANLGGSRAEPTMLWPFNHFRKPRLAPRGTIEAIYGMIVTQAREPLFYRDLGVPDTVNGRFDLLLMHLWLVLRQLKSAGSGGELSQALFDHFCNDMDDNLRELGVSDLKVPKRMQVSARHFMAAPRPMIWPSPMVARPWRRRCAGMSSTARGSNRRAGSPPMPRRR